MGSYSVVSFDRGSMTLRLRREDSPAAHDSDDDEDDDDSGADAEMSAPAASASSAAALLAEARRLRSARAPAMEMDADMDRGDGDDEDTDTPAAAASTPAPPLGRGRRERRAGAISGQVKEAEIRRISGSIQRIQRSIGRLSPYSTQGAQSATTTATSGRHRVVRTTADNMHSEMRAISDMLRGKHWQLEDGQIRTSDGEEVDGGDFRTPVPHCGHCTIMLSVLGLPLTTPTAGRYNMASNNNYPLPDEVKRSRDVVLRILNGGEDRPDDSDDEDSKAGGEYDLPLNRILDIFFPGNHGNYAELWNQVSRNPAMLDELWSWIFAAVYRNVG
ncbi:MAG: hypothetical protein R3B70_22030 [Polyangiaceae bacterium]